jgi:hypothetical protein
MHGARDFENRSEEKVTGMIDQTREKVLEIDRQAGEAASAAEQPVGSAVTSVGSRMSALAGTIREKMPHEGMLGTTSEKVATGLERGGLYLQEEALKGMVEDIASLVRRNPLPALLLGFGIGFVIGRKFRS